MKPHINLTEEDFAIKRINALIAKKKAKIFTLGSDITALELRKNKILMKDVKPCDLNYYQIRGGHCAHGSVNRGHVVCVNPNCENS